MHKGKLLLIGSALRAINLVITCLVSLLMAPFLITHLGDRIYGMWMLVGSLFGFYSMFDLGLTTAVQRFLSREVGREDYKEGNVIINTALITFSIIGLITFLITIVITLFAHRFFTDPAEMMLFKQFILIMGVNVSLYYPMRTFAGVLESHLRYDLIIVTELFNLIIRTILIVCFLLQGYGLITVAVIILSINILSHILRIILAKRIAKYMQISRQYFNFKKLKTFFGYSVYTLISQISHRIANDIDNFVIAGFMGLQYVTIYSLASRLGRYFRDFVWSGVGLFTPVFSQYESTGNYDAIREKYLFISKISWCASLIVGGCMIILGHAFITRWVGVEYIEAYPVFVLLIVLSMIGLFNTAGNNLVYGISKHKIPAFIGLAGSLVNLGLSIIFVKHWGLMGVALGTAIPTFIIGLFVSPVYVCHVIEMSVRKYYITMLPSLVVTSLYLWASWWLVKGFIQPSYLTIGLWGGVICFIYCFLAFGLLFNKQEKQDLFHAMPLGKVKTSPLGRKIFAVLGVQ